MSIQTTPGSVQLTPKAIEAHGRERSRLATTCFAGIALLLLIIIYGIALFEKLPAGDNLAGLIGTIFGLFVGHFVRHGD